MNIKEKIKYFIEGMNIAGIASIAGTLWRAGGSGNYSRYFRRVGVALVITIQSWLFTHNLWCLLTFPLAFASYTLGYGIPDKTDAGCRIARIWCVLLGYKIRTNGFYIVENENKLRFLVRATVGFCYSLSYIPTAIILKHDIGVTIAVLALTLLIPAICHLRFNAVKEESLIGGVILIGLGIVKLIKF